MDNGAVRRLLWRWGGALDAIARRQDELARTGALAKAAYDSIRMSVVTGVPRGTDTSLTSVERAVDAAGDLAAAYEEQLNRLTVEIEEMLRFKTAVDACVNALPEPQRGVIERRYKDGADFGLIASRLGYSVGWARSVESAAVAALADGFEAIGT
jgi:DNA-directed RNA polymerase specialized sigma24 family protein